MKSAQPQWRTDLLSCPLNAGKLSSVTQLIVAMRQCATREAALQWQQFHRKHWTGFESMASKGWNRPWIKSGKLTTGYGQMVMAQVAGSLQGYFGNVMNTYTSLVSGSTLSPTIRHQLHSINRQSAWFQVGAVTVEQVTFSTTAAGKTAQNKAKVVIGSDVRDLARSLIRRAISQHRKPHFRGFQPQIDQRAVFLQQPQQAVSQDLWLVLTGRQAGQRLALPVKTHPHFLKRQKRATYDQSLDYAGDHRERMIAGVQNAVIQSRVIDPDPKKQAKKKHHVKRMLADEPDRNPYPSGFALAKTIRLLLSEDQKSLSIAVATDMRSTHEQSAACYCPKMGALGLDMGLRTLFGSDQGDLLGRHWLSKLERYDRLLQSIARHRQQLGLKTASPRYRRIVDSLRGLIKSEINRIFNRLVKDKAPSQFIMERPGFYRNPKLSRRLNRIMSNFGAGIVTAKLKELETQFGITTQFVPAAYSSQSCSSCGSGHFTQARVQWLKNEGVDWSLSDITGSLPISGLLSCIDRSLNMDNPFTVGGAMGAMAAMFGAFPGMAQASKEAEEEIAENKKMAAVMADLAIEMVQSGVDPFQEALNGAAPWQFIGPSQMRASQLIHSRLPSGEPDPDGAIARELMFGDHDALKKDREAYGQDMIVFIDRMSAVTGRSLLSSGVSTAPARKIKP